jgi:hypothetical protein
VPFLLQTNLEIMNQPLSSVSRAAFNAVELNIHHASQLLARFAQTFLPHAKDESHPSQQWHPSLQSLIGKSSTKEPNIQLGLGVLPLKLNILDTNGNTLHHLKLEGLTPLAAEKWLIQALADLGYTAQGLDDMPYALPMSKDTTYQQNENEALQQWMLQRTFANDILTEVQKAFNGHANIAIWPHHFDTGIYLSVVSNEEAGDKALGIGWAVADDNVVDENYLYIYAWSSKQELHYEHLPDLTNGHWCIEQEGWKGGILTLSDLVQFRSAQDQKAAAIQFLKETSQLLLTRMNLPQLF